jgi:diacylglycerol kinase
VIATAIALNCDPYSWCLLLLCFGFVFVSEMFNTALETLFRGLDERVRNRCYRCLDISAGAVFLASVTAVLVGAIIFLRRLAITFHWM